MAPGFWLGGHVGGWGHHSWSGECRRSCLCVLRGLCNKTIKVGGAALVTLSKIEWFTVRPRKVFENKI